MAMLILIQTPLGAIGVPDGVLRAGQVQHLCDITGLQQRLADERERLMEAARARADAHVEQADAEARRILEQSREEAERIRHAAHEEGLRRAAQEWYERQTETAVDKARSVREVHAKLADVVTHAVERIVQTEDRAALYQRALKSVQSLTRGASTLRLRVGPDDHEHARQCMAAVDLGQLAGLEVEVVADNKLRAGSCIFESELGVLDASLQTQLDGLRAAMERAVQRAAMEHPVADDPSPQPDGE
jgi:type III secretion protein L